MMAVDDITGKKNVLAWGYAPRDIKVGETFDFRGKKMAHGRPLDGARPLRRLLIIPPGKTAFITGRCFARLPRPSRPPTPVCG